MVGGRNQNKIAVVEAKAKCKSPSEGLQQAKEYALMLGLKFAYATNGEGIVEFDFTTGKECFREESRHRPPAELDALLPAGQDPGLSGRALMKKLTSNIQ